MRSSETLFCGAMWTVLVCSAAIVANAATPTTATNPPDEAVVLSPFEVTTTTDNSYAATNAATGTRIAVPLVQLPFTASVITSAFIEDRGAINLTEATRFVPSLRRGTNNNEAFTLRGFNSGVPRRNYFSNVG